MNVQRSGASGYTFPGALLLLDVWRSPAGEGSLDERYGDVEVVGLFDSALAAEGEDADLLAGLSEVARGHGGLRSRIAGQGRKLVRRGLGF